MTLTIRGDADQRTIDQITRCMTDNAIAGALCADAHVGYSMPIGGVIAYRDHISPSGVGYDIGCGNKAVRTDFTVADLGPEEVPAIMDEIVRRISFGVGRNNDEPIDHPVLGAITNAPFEPQRKLAQLAANQLGTVGAGNHYVDLFEDEQGWLWVGCHFGSRGFGHKTATGFLALNQGRAFDEKGSEGEMDSPPILFSTNTDLGQAYIEAMTLAGEYAYAGRDTVIAKVLKILGAEATLTVHNHHNFAWQETIQGENVWVVRKGCTPAYPGQQGFVGSTMGEESVILQGIESEAGETLLHSTVHGAGRVMSRTQAAGKQGTIAECSDRDCHYSKTWKQYKAEPSPFCPDHPDNRVLKVRKRIREGEINWTATLDDLASKHIVLRGGAADEAPGAYKRLDDVLAYHADTIEILHRLKPIGVAMAGADVYDPYKD